MNTVKIIHTADIHLGSARTGLKNGKIEIENTFLRIIRICKTEGVDFLLIAGDLFDSPFIERNDAERIISMMAQIPETVIAISTGNHDPACPGSVYLKYKFPQNVIIFQSFAEYFDFPERGVRLWGAGFTDNFEKIPLIKGFEVAPSSFINIGVLHANLMPDNSPSNYNPITFEQIENSGLDYLALGHIHKRTSVQKLGKTHFSYCGCPDGMGFDETGSHGIYIGTISNGVCNLEYMEMSSRIYACEAVNVSDCANSFNTAEKVSDHIKAVYGENFARNLYRITLTGTVSADLPIDSGQVQSILSDSIDHISVKDATFMDISDISKIVGETSLRGIFAKKMLDRINSADTELKEVYENALKLGLRAFSKGVKLHDN